MRLILFLAGLLACMPLAADNPSAAEKAVVAAGKNARFTVLTPQLIRMEWSADGVFEDRASLTFINRELPVPQFKVSKSGTRVIIKTAALTLTYKISEGAFSASNLKAEFKTAGKNYMFSLLRNDGISIGDAFKYAKNRNSASFSRQRFNNEHYVLIGEPVTKILKAGLKVTLDQKLDTLKALDKVKLSGSVSGLDNGTIELSLRESRNSKRLYLGLPDLDDDTLDVMYDGTLIYSEKVPVVGGRYETEFVTPRKISFGDTAVEFNAWAYSNEERDIGRFRVGGIGIYGFSAYADSIHDTQPPTIKIQNCFSNGTEASFADEETVKLQAPACLQVVVEDSTALDFREQADEGITIEVEGIENPYHPYPYLEQSSKKAVLRKSFTLESFPEGHYVFRVRALDVLGNAATKAVNLDITEDMKSGLVDVFNVPNPVGKKGTTFYFKNLAVDRASQVNIFIYNQHGRLVKVIIASFIISLSV